ncbi:hypothetical protein LX15_005660 [Streptoalloteichus tenebrarius]|uniref:Secreted protein n=1 Tax=Streptoalloteichus tenebrarius (strain ATCC 17920 / DSM 40477 / JCM 4838 / CBS 697.72 / NBRC 16177 / NCIMB 11028 / NRRL B-12390 / A12253. 1 / ISP 5477) TaxID=1933 RepID=A0ABT1I2C2_STRSD|nr:hypothetical protein [Streptoalloteichus tenebrarius]MCP2261933.1 hypothetical protein [Streptoalloteichus tenebrarius]BFF02074.1 hypothetical protein GCM10020241_37490 [Streptoalloteichus tenebrarius]
MVNAGLAMLVLSVAAVVMVIVTPDRADRRSEEDQDRVPDRGRPSAWCA